MLSLTFADPEAKKARAGKGERRDENAKPTTAVDRAGMGTSRGGLPAIVSAIEACDAERPRTYRHVNGKNGSCII